MAPGSVTFNLSAPERCESGGGGCKAKGANTNLSAPERCENESFTPNEIGCIMKKVES